MLERWRPAKGAAVGHSAKGNPPGSPVATGLSRLAGLSCVTGLARLAAIGGLPAERVDPDGARTETRERAAHVYVDGSWQLAAADSS